MDLKEQPASPLTVSGETQLVMAPSNNPILKIVELILNISANCVKLYTKVSNTPKDSFLYLIKP